MNLNKKCVKPKQVLRYYVADRDVDVMGGQVVLEGGADADAVSLTGSNLTRKGKFYVTTINIVIRLALKNSLYVAALIL